MKELLKVKDLKVFFELHKGWVEDILSKEKSRLRAVDGIDFSIKKGEVLSLVGESGSGKTTTGKAVLQLLDHYEGEVFFNGSKIDKKNKIMTRTYRQKAQMIYQDPYQSLNPKDTIFDIIAEPLVVNKLVNSVRDKKDKVVKAMEQAGLRPPENFLEKFPHELSGGQRQRVAIAAAFILNPELIIADEPVSMLDVSVRADILKVMIDLQKEKEVSYLFITHDLSLAWLISDRIAIMYLGKIVEIGNVDEVIKGSLHPYTRALINVMPKIKVKKEGEKRLTLSGETPNPINIPRGCRFSPRCSFAQEICKVQEPELRDLGGEHLTACHFAEELREENVDVV